MADDLPFSESDPVTPTLQADPPEILVDLWRRRLDTMISGIANGDHYYQQLANAAEHISAEYRGRFLIELIQNANDQAVRARLLNSAVTIVRTRSLIAVGNSGQPFDAGRVDAITSIFKSDKTADECIGNKGIGFKAVFQVADSAEIFSSSPGCSLADGTSIAFRIARGPLSDPDFHSLMQTLAIELLDRYCDRRTKIEQRFPDAPALDVVLREAARAAWFTFPLPISPQGFSGRVEQLGVNRSVLSEMQTLIVLPLRNAANVTQRVDEAIDEIRGGDGSTKRHPAGATFLFLPGISRMDILDRARGIAVELRKLPPSVNEDLGNGVLLRRQRTISKEYKIDHPDGESTSQDWWLVERLVGGNTGGDDTGAERQAIRDAIKSLRLPEENWKDVEQVPVSVALPAPALADGAVAMPLGCCGRFCIGLPTQVQTGSPLWVSSHFHGRIDRTAIDFGNAYNGLLFDAVAALAAALIQRLKADPNLGTKRLATLAMERGSGKLADAFYSPLGLAHTEVVLDDAGDFIAGIGLCLPKAIDLDMFLRLIRHVPSVTPYGLHLPDRNLLANARKVLDGLAPEAEVKDTIYLDRPRALPSLLEVAAKAYRAEGPAFWEPYLRWVLDRFGSAMDSLGSQLLLPVGKDGLAKSASRVFFSPVTTGGSGGEEDGGTKAIDDGGDELASVDDLVLPLLQLFDDSAIKVRTGTGRDYTPLAQRLAPSTGLGLVRRPRQSDLINDALIPAMQKLKEDSNQSLVLLRQALAWLVSMPTKSKQRVATGDLLVPTRGRGDAWEWVPPDQAYLGPGWADGPEVELLTKAYGSRNGAQLISWDRFEKRLLKLSSPGDKAWWCERLREIGVWDSPRIIRHGQPLGVAQSDSYSQLTGWMWVGCPTPCIDGMWSRYFDYVCRRPANTKSGQHFYLHDVTWIDGLEDREVRPVVLEAMLRKPGRYESVMHDHLSRRYGEDSREVWSLWVYALRDTDLPVIPTSHGLERPSEAWFLPLEARATKADRFGFLPCAKAEFSSARRLLGALGVLSIEEAAVPRLLSALRHLASHVPEATPESLRHIEAIAADVYEAVEIRLKGGETTEGLKGLLEFPVPLLHENRITAVAITTIDRLVVDDDPVRRQHLGGFSGSWVLPTRFGQTYSALVEALRTLMGHEKVVRVSECAIDIQFLPLDGGCHVLDYLRLQCPGRPLAEEIALLIVKGGTQAASPYDPAFTDSWRRITQSRIVRGKFEGSANLKACFDAQYAGGPVLMVDSRLDVHEVLAELWQLISSANRDTWAAYGTALKEGTTDRFFADRGVSAAERTEVEALIGLGFEQRLRKYQPVCLAVWRSAHSEGSIDTFCAEWSQYSKTAEGATSWLTCPHLAAWIELAMQNDEPDSSVRLLGQFGLTVPQWQMARRELGVDPWRFVTSERIYAMARAAVIGHLSALFAYLLVPRASGASGPTLVASLADKMSLWLASLQQLAVPDEVAQQPLPSERVVAHVAADALRALDSSAASELKILADSLAALMRAAPADLASIKLKDEPDKAASIYETDDPTTRQQQAGSAVDSLLWVAGPLAGKHGEDLDPKKVTEHQMVTLLSQGRWANRISVVAAVRYALETLAPKTALRMKERQAFHGLDDWRVLWRKFEELGELPKPAVTPPPKPKFDVLGSQWTEDDFRTSAASGEEGGVAQQIQKAVDPTINLQSLSSITRDKVQVKVRRGRGTGGGGGTRRMPDEYLTMLGAIGEHFVYSQLKAALPDFDLTHWRSKMKEVFGYGTGDDGLGYDFEYPDLNGILTQRPDRSRCLIEVKSSANENCDTFEMTTNEWDVARQCHTGERDAVYIIIRVTGTASTPSIVDILIDPIALHLQGVLDYSSRDLLVEVGAPTQQTNEP